MSHRATIVGAGGLGGPIALALGAAGVELTIFDHDRVELSNLHRQIQFTAADLEAPKATRLAATVVARGGTARGIVARWPGEAPPDTDVIIDASDAPATKFAVADWATAHRRPYVIAAALRYGGNAMAGAPDTACYRCLFEDPPDQVASCAAAGVLGPVVGAIGGVAASLALGLLSDDRTHAGSLFVFDDLRRDAAPRIVRFARRAGCPACAQVES